MPGHRGATGTPRGRRCPSAALPLRRRRASLARRLRARRSSAARRDRGRPERVNNDGGRQRAADPEVQGGNARRRRWRGPGRASSPSLNAGRAAPRAAPARAATRGRLPQNAPPLGGVTQGSERQRQRTQPASVAPRSERRLSTVLTDKPSARTFRSAILPCACESLLSPRGRESAGRERTANGREVVKQTADAGAGTRVQMRKGPAANLFPILDAFLITYIYLPHDETEVECLGVVRRGVGVPRGLGQALRFSAALAPNPPPQMPNPKSKSQMEIATCHMPNCNLPNATCHRYTCRVLDYKSDTS